MSATPKVTDQFWFDQSQTAITTAEARHNEASAKVSTALIWLWGVYTAAISVGIALPQKVDLPAAALALLVLPIPLLLLGYFCAIWSQVPRLVGFDPRSPTEIQEAFSQSMVIRSTRLRLGLLLTVTSAVLVSVAVMAASITKPSPSPSLRAVLQSDGSKWILLVAGRVAPSTQVHLRVIPLVGSEWDKVGNWAKVSDHPLLSGPNGDFGRELAVEPSPGGYEVVADWSQDGIPKGITTVSRPYPGTSP